MRKYPFKHKFLKRYSLDFFNQFGYQNTKNKAALTVRFALRQKVRKIAARRKKIHKRKVLSILRRSRKKNRRAFAVFSVTDRARAKPKKSLSFGGLLLAYRKKVFTYYVPRLSRKALRKYVNRANKRFSLSRLFECRLDALLLRSNFINTVLEARDWIYKYQVRVAIPKKREKYSFRICSSPNFWIPPFTPFTLRSPWPRIRMNFLRKILSVHKFIAYPPSYLTVSYAMFLSFVNRNPRDHDVRLPFGGLLSTAGGLARYF